MFQVPTMIFDAGTCLVHMNHIFSQIQREWVTWKTIMYNCLSYDCKQWNTIYYSSQLDILIHGFFISGSSTYTCNLLASSHQPTNNYSEWTPVLGARHLPKQWATMWALLCSALPHQWREPFAWAFIAYPPQSGDILF